MSDGIQQLYARAIQIRITHRRNHPYGGFGPWLYDVDTANCIHCNHFRNQSQIQCIWLSKREDYRLRTIQLFIDYENKVDRQNFTEGPSQMYRLDRIEYFCKVLHVAPDDIPLCFIRGIASQYPLEKVRETCVSYDVDGMDINYY